MSASIRKAIRQKRPFDSIQTEALISLMRTSDVLLERAHRPICAHGLTAAQYNVLRILRGAGDEGLQTYQVAERLITRATNITRLVDKLERKGLIRRHRSEEDRRVVRLDITAAGLELLNGLDAPVLQATKTALRGLEDDELERLCRTLDRLRRPVEEETTP